MDALASLVNLVAVRWSLLPPDAEHRFGHGKAQALAALAQSVFIAGSALFVGVEAVDRLLGLGIGAFVLWSALRIGRDAVQLLLDHELPRAQSDEILELAQTTPQVRGVHSLRTRQSGQTMIIQLHLGLDDELSLREAHQVAMKVEARIRARYPESDLLIHQDPISLGDEEQRDDPRRTAGDDRRPTVTRNAAPRPS